MSFGENTNTSYSVNVRPDVWVFPFLNVYGIFGYGQSETNVQLVEPVAMPYRRMYGTEEMKLLLSIGDGMMDCSPRFRKKWTIHHFPI
jgi:hypothetical protein